TDRKNLVENELFEAKQQRGFLECLTEIIKTVHEEYRSFFKKLRDDVYLMTPEEYGYFVALLKFDYYYEDRSAQPD
ncbi:MAG TPA: hypothetical protein VHC48_11640, partial [Puia sp.]|nr:hypothetical protein [Puia sp.]